MPLLLIIIRVDLSNLMTLKFEEKLLPRNEEIEKNGGGDKKNRLFY